MKFKKYIRNYIEYISLLSFLHELKCFVRKVRLKSLYWPRLKCTVLRQAGANDHLYKMSYLTQ
jgi:hypothetical protein